MSYTVKVFRDREHAEDALTALQGLGWKRAHLVECIHEEIPESDSAPPPTDYVIRAGTQWLMDNGEMH